MAWTLWEMLWALLADVEPVKLALSGAKTALGAIGSYLLKRVWRSIVGADDKVITSNCYIKTCQRMPGADAKYRGLCPVCYSEAKKLVDSNQTTWEGLASKGLCSSGQASSPFNDAYSKAMEGE